MRLSTFVFFGLAVLSCLAQAQTQAPAQVSLESFSWRTNSRFELQLYDSNGPMELRGELQDGATQTYPINETWSAEIKSYTTELFVVVALTSIQDENGYLFFLERPQETWLLMNETPVRARKLDLMKDFEGVIEAFKQVGNFGVAQSLRKMVEFSEVYPDGRLQDVYDALERGDDFVLTVPRPRGSSAEQLGIVQPDIPGFDQPAVANTVRPSPSEPVAPSPSFNTEPTPSRDIPSAPVEPVDTVTDFPAEPRSRVSPEDVQGDDPLADALRRALGQN